MSDANLPPGTLNFAPKIQIKAFGTYIGPREKLLQQLAQVEADLTMPDRDARIAELQAQLSALPE